MARTYTARKVRGGLTRAELHLRVCSLVEADMCAKEIAHELGYSLKHIYIILDAAGCRYVLMTPDEARSQRGRRVQRLVYEGVSA